LTRVGLRRAALVLPAALVTAALALSSCGSSGVTTLSAPPTTDVSLTLTLQRSPVGPILATGNGNTLYDFGPDTDTTSACVNDGCVFQWPPLTKSGPIRVGRGVDPSLVGTIRRTDGSTQITYGGHPLYTYNLDVTPGMVTGQAIDQDGGPWYVIDAAGRQITKSFAVSAGNGIPNPKS
jgi:predicted lipoprotein with Yx(FWY)xxD motif